MTSKSSRGGKSRRGDLENSFAMTLSLDAVFFEKISNMFTINAGLACSS